MRSWLIVLAILCVTGLFNIAQADEFASYYERSLFLSAPPTAYEFGMLGFANPALPSMIDKFEARYMWTSDGTDVFSHKDWGLFTALKGFSFGSQRRHLGDYRVSDSHVSLSSGNQGISYGIGYSWSGGDTEELGREKLFSAGMVYRPLRHISLGLVGNFSTESSAREGIVEAAVRPLGNPLLTIFGDYAIQGWQRVDDAPWSVGAAFELLSGFSVVGRYFESEAFTVGLSLNFGRGGLGGQTHFDNESNRTHQTYSVRLGGYVPSFLTMPPIRRGKVYTPFELKGRVDHLRYRLFDANTHSLLGILEDIRAAANDPRVDVIAMNLSGMRVLPEHAWEIREELTAARENGKKIVVFIDLAEMTEYHLASVSDWIMLDPEGVIMLPGYMMGRIYLSGTLKKLGIGFDEWRFFEYKSALEGYSRDSMSDADRRQRQELVDSMYELACGDISGSRDISSDRLETIVDKEVILSAQDALAEGLVDTLCRWSDLAKVMEAVTGAKKHSMPRNMLLKNAEVRRDWGRIPRIAVVYALGVCDMDTGINARWLERIFKHLEKDESVRAVVFRVDSPGGDGMASDVVAEALRSCAERKPVIVSQGQVAASGGYWVSMYADTIVAGPNTITGSIGVIGGWFYDDGFYDKLGVSTDHVRRGEHADLGLGVTLPLIGLHVPDRNLTGDERTLLEKYIRDAYLGFTKKVAVGRGMTPEEVDRIGQGRVYSGVRGREIGLVDEIGGLRVAIEIATRAAGMPPEQEIELVEYPHSKGLFGLAEALTGSRRAGLDEDPWVEFMRRWSERPWYPMPVMLPGEYPTLD